MPSEIRVFISSKQSEFASERAVLAHLIRGIPSLEPVLAEEWNPTGTGVHDVYLNDVRTSPIYVGLFGAVYSEPTYREYLAACENPYREKLIYLKQSDNVDERLQKLIIDFNDRHVPSKFRAIEDIVPAFSKHLITALSRMITTLQLLGENKPTAHGGGGTLQKRWAARQQQLKQLGLSLESEPQEGSLIVDIGQAIIALRHKLDGH